MPRDPSKNMLSATEAAALLGVSIVTLRRWDESEKLKSTRAGKNKHRQYALSDLQVFLHEESAKQFAATQKNTFIFDFDSTLFPEETLDAVLQVACSGLPQKQQADIAKKLEEICSAGMNGEIDLFTSITSRLQVANIQKEHIETYLESRASAFTKTMQQVIKLLQKRNHAIFVISGGFLEWVQPLASSLGVSKKNIYANSFRWNGNTVAGVVKSNPLAHSGGKPEVIHALRGAGKITGQVCMIGDGSSDLEVYEQGEADIFIGYGVHAVRKKVQEASPFYFTKEKEFTSFIQTIT